MGNYGRSLRFGVIVNADARGYEEASALVRRANEAGLDLVGVPDHPYSRGLLDTLSLIAALGPERSGCASSPTSPNCPSGRRPCSPRRRPRSTS